MEKIQATQERLKTIMQNTTKNIEKRTQLLETELTTTAGLCAEGVLKTCLIHYIGDCIAIFKKARKDIIKCRTLDDDFTEQLEHLIKTITDRMNGEF